MKFFILYFLLFTFSFSALSTDTSLPEPDWKLIGPGDADQVTSISIMSNGDVIIGSDIGGLYLSNDDGLSWHHINAGLNNLDITTKVLQDPKDDSTLLVGTRGGLYKSIDYGNTWSNVRNGLPELERYKLSGSIGAVASNPHNDNIMALGIGYRPSYDGTNTVRKSPGSNQVYLSRDRGNTWNKTNGMLPADTKISQLEFSHRSKNTIYAATNNGLYVSNSLGNEWSNIYSDPVYNLLLDIHDDNTIYIAAGQKGLLKSTDNGESWYKINKGISFFDIPGRFKNRFCVITSDNKQKTFYAINSTWGRSGGLYRSDDKGVSWIKITNKMPESWLKTSSRMNDIAISSTDPNHIYVGSSRYIYTSYDQGSSWKQLISKKSSNGWTSTGLNIFGQTRTVVGDKFKKNTLYVGTADHKILRSNDYGYSWNLLLKNDNHANYVWDIDQCSVNGKSIHMITSDNSKYICTMKSDDHGETWGKSCDFNLKANWKEKIRVSPHDCSHVTISANGSLFISKNGGSKWDKVNITNSKIHVRSIEYDRNDKNNIYVGTSKGLYRSIDSGATWKLIDSTNEYHVTSIFIPKATKNIIFIGTELSGNKPASIYKSFDSGSTWTRALTNQRKYISAITSLPANRNIMYASTLDDNYHDESKGAGIYRSIDKGENWHRIDRTLPVFRAYNITTSELHPYDVLLATNGSGAYVANEKSLLEFISR